MAFEVPQHLPRRALPQDVSSKILNRIDSATVKDLDANLANSWVEELDESIAATKTRIHDRIQEDLPIFRRQLEASKLVQARLEKLGTEVNTLNERISSTAGLVPTTLHRLQAHATLAQEASDASVIADSLTYLLKCKQQYTFLTSLVTLGKLPEAVVASKELEQTCNSSPEALEKARVMIDLKHKLQVLKARIEEQLLDTLENILLVQPSRLTVRTEASIQGCDGTVTLDAALKSLSPNSLQDFLVKFRKHFTTYFIENVLQQPFSVGEGISMTEHAINLIPTSPNSESRKTRLENLAHILDFVQGHVFPKLPESESTSFPRSFVKPLTNGILNLFLAPLLPSSFGLLPPFLELVNKAVEFEEEYIISLLKASSQDRPLKEWSDGLASHYERQRRNAILENSRLLIKEPIDLSSTFLAEVEQEAEISFPTAVNGAGEAEDDAWGLGDSLAPVSTEEPEDSWGFDDDVNEKDRSQNVAEPIQEAVPEKKEDSWGLDDDTQAEESWGFDDNIDSEVVESESTIDDPGPSSPKPKGAGDPELDPDDAWGWKDDGESAAAEDPVADSNAWDDPWGEPEVVEANSKPVPVKAPKIAKRLEKLASKNKKQSNGNAKQSPPLSPAVLPSIPSSSTAKALAPPNAAHKPAPKPAAIITKVHPPAEQYRVTERTKRILRIVENAIAEGKQFAASNLFSKLSTSSAPGSTLFQTASSVLDLYQALYPIRYEPNLQSMEGTLQFANDCLYLGDSINQLEQEVSLQSTLKERLSEAKENLKTLGDSLFQDAVERGCRNHDQILTEGTQGFTYTMDQDRYDECENAINQVVRSLKDCSRRTKPILAKSKYYQALGRFVDAALSRVLRDIVALPDITEVESHRLSELCRIFNSLEGLFSEDPNQPSFVVAYVPSWLKFNYLSELLEASLADITYLFEEGALVDFETDELVRLVRSLFADTPLRANTINKLLTGHSQSSS